MYLIKFKYILEVHLMFTLNKTIEQDINRTK